MHVAHAVLVSVLFVLVCAFDIASAIPYPFSPNHFKRECKDMFPEALGVHSQLTKPPYEISTSDTIYDGVSHEQVTIKATGPYKINAFSLQARVADCSATDREEPIGYFEKEFGYDDVELIHCSGRHDSAVVSRKWKINKENVVVRWYKPKNETRKLFFRATIVATVNLFWMENFSDSIRSIGSNKAGQVCPVRLMAQTDGATANSSHSFLIVAMFIYMFVFL
ncbi:putative defense protein [Mizuhopecten yessoensis]|uniref:Defense protein n=1 Tax=Mizuhopecten yessoensis TaxID=6573 RepID=A0A210Q7S9_MIZYE|nr:putative defense protein [Mizuhopecten yessoensis]OWF44781.1 defense protein [Mizuhopecten yessoensis]